MKVMTVTIILLLLIGITSIGGCSSSSGNRRTSGSDFRLPVNDISTADSRGAKGGGFSIGPGDYGRTIKVDGRKRYYEIHVPPSYSPSKPMPLVMVFHGGGSDHGVIRYESQMDRTADRGGFIVVYPSGTNKRLVMRNRILFWNDGRAYKDGRPNKVNDVKFVNELIDDLQRLFRIDAKRVYTCGYSNGAQFSFRLIKQMSHRIAAVAAVAGQRAADELFPSPPRPVAIMQFSGKQDTIGPYDGGKPHFEAELITNIKPIPETVGSWVAFNSCSKKPQSSQAGNAVMQRYTGCKDGVEVVLWTLQDGGHTWPGGNVIPAAERFGLGPINRDISASDQMWDFFRRFRLQ